MLNLHVVYQTKNPAYTRQRAADHIGILVHSTGANNKYVKRYVDAPDLLGVNQYNNHWNNTDADKCMHAFVGLDINKEPITVQTLPYEYACSGCGKGSKGSYNYNPTAHIQFEICEGSATDADYYWLIIKQAEEYCAYLCRLYGWTAANITSHVEANKAGYASNHGDPTSWMKNFGDSMDKFRTRVAALLNENKEEPVMKTYKVIGTRLAWRDKPTTTNSTVMARLDTGTIVKGTPEPDTEWIKVPYDNYVGYCMAKYLEEVVEEPKVEVSEPTDAEKLSILWKWYKETKGA